MPYKVYDVEKLVRGIVQRAATHSVSALVQLAKHELAHQEAEYQDQYNRAMDYVINNLLRESGIFSERTGVPGQGKSFISPPRTAEQVARDDQFEDELPVRVLNVLNANFGRVSLEDVTNMRRSEFMKLPNIGVRSTRDMDEVLKIFGASWTPEVQS